MVALKIVTHYNCGVVKTEADCTDTGIRHGLTTTYYDSSAVSSTSHWISGKRYGLTETYSPSGSYINKIYYVDSQVHGECVWFGITGKIEHHDYFNNGVPIVNLITYSIDDCEKFELQLTHGGLWLQW